MRKWITNCQNKVDKVFRLSMPKMASQVRRTHIHTHSTYEKSLKDINRPNWRGYCNWRLGSKGTLDLCIKKSLHLCKENVYGSIYTMKNNITLNCPKNSNISDLPNGFPLLSRTRFNINTDEKGLLNLALIYLVSSLPITSYACYIPTY